MREAALSIGVSTRQVRRLQYPRPCTIYTQITGSSSLTPSADPNPIERGPAGGFLHEHQRTPSVSQFFVACTSGLMRGMSSNYVLPNSLEGIVPKRLQLRYVHT